MITKLKLHNWKSFKDSVVYVDSLTFLIGTNASGKSNVLDAFLLLHLLLKGVPFEEAVSRIRGGEDWLIRQGTHEMSLTITVENDGKEHEYTISINKDEDGLHLVKDIDLRAIDKAIIEAARNIFILNPEPQNMRNYSKVSKELHSDAGNIAGVIASMKTDEKNALEEKLTRYIKPLPEKDINKLTAVTVGLSETDAMLYCYEEWHPAKPVDARGMSDGTLRFAAIIVSLLTLKAGSLLIIEEVDNGLHPSRAKELVKVLKEISNERHVDVLCTTHNPVLMDELGNEMIPFISFVKRDEQGNSFIQLLEDKDNLAKLMASGTVGDMMTEDVL